MNRGADAKEELKNILRWHLGKAASSLFINKSLAIIDESAHNKESFLDAALKISKRTELFIDKALAQTVYKSLIDAIGIIDSPQGTRRRHRRIIFEKKIRIRYDGTYHEFDADNLSESGMFIKCNEPFPSGSELELTLPLGAGSYIALKGVVVHQRSAQGQSSKRTTGMGIEFTEVREKEKVMLQNHILRASV